MGTKMDMACVACGAARSQEIAEIEKIEEIEPKSRIPRWRPGKRWRWLGAQR